MSGPTTSTEVLRDIDLPLDDRREGKVRVSWSLPDGNRLFVTTDRLSAFDRVITCVPDKGQVLNQLSAWWFRQTEDIVANHLLSVPDPNVTIARSATPLPVEVIVRGHITGVTDTSLWTRYAAGERTIDGHDLPEGLTKNAPLPEPIITPTTKGSPDVGATGGHDLPMSPSDVVDRGLVDPDLWHEVCHAALGLFERATERGRRAGMILADTKYEFGLGAGSELLLIDELHTPDSSRWWDAEGHQERIARGSEPRSLDKEMVRRALADAGYRGDGPVPELPDEVWQAAAARYIEVYGRLTGSRFVPGARPIGARIHAAVSGLEIRS